MFTLCFCFFFFCCGLTNFFCKRNGVRLCFRSCFCFRFCFQSCSFFFLFAFEFCQCRSGRICAVFSLCFQSCFLCINARLFSFGFASLFCVSHCKGICMRSEFSVFQCLVNLCPG